MNQPDFRHAHVEEKKVNEYLLSSVHERSKSKAYVFQRRGFNPTSWREFADALRLQAQKGDLIEEIETRYGARYNVDGIMQTPDGTGLRVRSIWQVDHGKDYPRLITAYPIE